MEHLPKKIHQNGISYTLVGEYYIPDLKLPEERRPIGSRVKRLAQGELMPASTRTGYYLTQNSQDLRLRRPFPGPRTSSQEGGNLFETDTTQWALRQAWHL